MFTFVVMDVIKKNEVEPKTVFYLLSVSIAIMLRVGKKGVEKISKLNFIPRYFPYLTQLFQSLS